MLPEEVAIYDTEQQIKRRERWADFFKVCVVRMFIAQVAFPGSKKTVSKAGKRVEFL